MDDNGDNPESPVKQQGLQIYVQALLFYGIVTFYPCRRFSVSVTCGFSCQ